MLDSNPLFWSIFPGPTSDVRRGTCTNLKPFLRLIVIAALSILLKCCIGSGVSEMNPKCLLLWDDEHLSTSNLFPLWPGTNSAIMEELWDFMHSRIILLPASYLMCALERLVKVVSVKTIEK